MNRRRFLAAGAAAGLTATAGCLGVFADYGRDVPPVLDAPPDGVYVPTYVAGRHVVGTASAGDLRLGLAYTIPHRYWTVSGTATTYHEPASSDQVYLMAVLFDGDGRVLPLAPDTEVVVRLDVGALTAATLAPALSPRFGFHLGANTSMPSQGKFTAEVTLQSPPTPLTGEYAGALDSETTVDVPFDWNPRHLQTISYSEPEDAGTPGATTLVDDAVPVSRAPAADALPGDPVGTATLDDARLVVRAVPGPSRFVDGDRTYLYVSPRSRYTRVPLPGLSLSGSLSSAGETTDLDFAPAVDHAAGYYLGAAVDGVSSGDEVELVVDAPPQVRRHEGYETAFLQMDRSTLTAP